MSSTPPVEYLSRDKTKDTNLVRILQDRKLEQSGKKHGNFPKITKKMYCPM